jgi:OOP family OmpA-OmpF porin
LPRQEADATTPAFLEPVSSHLKSGGDEAKRFVLDDLNFETGSAQLTAASRQTVDGLRGLLEAHPLAQVSIEGYTDNTGSPAANKQLAQQRAETVKEMLVQSGIGAGRMQAAGFGADRPVASNDTAGGRARNRRIELVVTAR